MFNQYTLKLKHNFLSAIVMSATLSGGSAVAATLQTDTSVDVGLSTVFTSSGTSSASSQAPNGNPNYYANALASQSGNVSASTRIDYSYAYNSDITDFGDGPHTNLATSQWMTNYTNTGVSQPLTLDFNINAGEIGYTALYGEESYRAGYGIDIMLDGVSIWSSHGQFDVLGADVIDDSINTAFFGNLGANKLTYSSGNSGGGEGTGFGASVFTFDPFNGQLDLGTFATGDSFELTYFLSVYAVSDYFIGDDYIYAQFGDPLDITGTPGMSATISAVPVPAAVYLFGSGLIGLAGFTRRSKK